MSLQPQFRCLYVGIRTPGTTSRLRSDALARALPKADWQVIDTDVPFHSALRISRSMAFRWRLGPAVTAINQYVLDRLPTEPLDLVWVDKGVCLWPSTVARLRKIAAKLVYYTPDTSFLHNQSRFFNRALSLYDRVVTTKSLELSEFHRRMAPDRRLFLLVFASRLARSASGLCWMPGFRCGLAGVAGSDFCGSGSAR
jgi:hypothetical protein